MNLLVLAPIHGIVMEDQTILLPVVINITIDHHLHNILIHDHPMDLILIVMELTKVDQITSNHHRIVLAVVTLIIVPTTMGIDHKNLIMSGHNHHHGQ